LLLNSTHFYLLEGQNKGKRETAANQVLKNLEQIAIVETNEVAEQKKRKREKAKLHDNDVDFCEKMISKHGEDYDVGFVGVFSKLHQVF
jgi:hypothetical protein